MHDLLIGFMILLFLVFLYFFHRLHTDYQKMAKDSIELLDTINIKDATNVGLRKDLLDSMYAGGLVALSLELKHLRGLPSTLDITINREKLTDSLAKLLETYLILKHELPANSAIIKVNEWIQIHMDYIEGRLGGYTLPNSPKYIYGYLFNCDTDDGVIVVTIEPFRSITELFDDVDATINKTTFLDIDSVKNETPSTPSGYKQSWRSL